MGQACCVDFCDDFSALCFELSACFRYKKKFSVEKYLNALPDDTTEIVVTGIDLTYLPDLSRFRNLRELWCSNNHLTALPTLPETLQRLFCGYNRLTSLPTLPENLESIVCNHNRLTALSTLPENLEYLRCNRNLLRKLPEFNYRLRELYCGMNQLVTLPVLNNCLERLKCDNNQLTRLPKLNDNLRTLACYNNQLTHLPELNNWLKELYCHENALVTLPILNDCLEKLHCDYKQLELFMVAGNLTPEKREVINKLIRMRYKIMCLKYKKHFMKFLWDRVRRPKIEAKYHPSNLQRLLDSVESEDVELMEVIECW